MQVKFSLLSITVNEKKLTNPRFKNTILDDQKLKYHSAFTISSVYNTTRIGEWWALVYDFRTLTDVYKDIISLSDTKYFI